MSTLRRHPLSLLMWLCSLALLSCTEAEIKPATQVIVSVHSDLRVGEDLVRVEARALTPDGRTQLGLQSFALVDSKGGGEPVTFPFSFGLTKGKVERFRLDLVGYGPGDEEPVIEQKQLVTFKAGQTLLLKVFLGRKCLGHACDGDDTCYLAARRGIEASACGPVAEATLVSIAPGAENDAWNDDAGAGTREDGGTQDGGSDAGATGAMSDAGPDADVDGGPLTDDGIETAGASCTRLDELACAGPASRSVLRCEQGKWELFRSCKPSERCNTGVGDSQGSCQPIHPACVGQAPADVVCLDGAPVECGPDLLNVSSDGAACGSGYSCDGTTGTTGCANIDECREADFCGPSLDCSDESGGYECIDPKKCEDVSICSDVYPCRTGATVGEYRCVGQFPEWQVSEAPDGDRFSVSDGVVTDSRTQLEWQQRSYGSATDCADDVVCALLASTCGTDATCTWSAAEAYCGSLRLKGGGWRVPSRAELLSIIDLTTSGPAIDTETFPGTQSDYYWSVTPHQKAELGLRWRVGFGTGNTTEGDEANSYFVRCVRG